MSQITPYCYKIPRKYNINPMSFVIDHSLVRVLQAKKYQLHTSIKHMFSREKFKEYYNRKVNIESTQKLDLWLKRIISSYAYIFISAGL